MGITSGHCCQDRKEEAAKLNKLLVIREISSGDVRCKTVIMVHNTVLHFMSIKSHVHLELTQRYMSILS